jgi:hypothetical protein
MANNQNEKHNLSESVTKYVTTSLDNIKTFVDQTADEVVKADVVGANRRIIDQVIEGTKDTITKVAESAARNDAMAAVRNLATGVVENAKETVRVATEETQRINLVETGAKVAQEGLDLVKRQLDLGFEAGGEIGQAAVELNPLKDMGADATKRPGVVTRVEIESDKGTIRTDAGTTAR